MSAVERFWTRVVETESDCWAWTGGKTLGGYGIFYLGLGRRTLAHRFAYEDMIAEIPEGLELDHLCRTTLCVNPWHLEPVTGQENNRRRDRANRRSHCPSGHPLTGNNLLVIRNVRLCRICKNAKWLVAYRRRQAGAA